ncbi:MAG: phosphonate metabolism transcriptional regulator PhnF [Acetobacteraceae bacterium]|nr:phosphonate metabolism transcriptional regulator PhnF [Acetobacteraceae bacterium]
MDVLDDRRSDTVERRAGVTLWRQIEAVLARELADGTFKAGQRLPTEQQLSARFRVNRHTVRRAMEELERRGLVRIEQGRGTFAAEDVIDYALSPRTRFSEIIARQNREPSGLILRVAEVVADEAAARALGVRRGRLLWRVERVGSADGRPVSFARHHFPQNRFPDLKEALVGSGGSITRALALCGVANYARRSTRISARLPSPDEAAVLEHPRNRPVLVTEAVNVDSLGTPIEYGVAVYPAGRVHLSVEF